MAESPTSELGKSESRRRSRAFRGGLLGEPCPQCGALAGKGCRSLTDHPLAEVHAERTGGKSRRATFRTQLSRLRHHIETLRAELDAERQARRTGSGQRPQQSAPPPPDVAARLEKLRAENRELRRQLLAWEEL